MTNETQNKKKADLEPIGVTGRVFCEINKDLSYPEKIIALKKSQNKPLKYYPVTFEDVALYSMSGRNFGLGSVYSRESVTISAVIYCPKNGIYLTGGWDDSFNLSPTLAIWRSTKNPEEFAEYKTDNKIYLNDKDISKFLEYRKKYGNDESYLKIGGSTKIKTKKFEKDKTAYFLFRDYAGVIGDFFQSKGCKELEIVLSNEEDFHKEERPFVKQLSIDIECGQNAKISDYWQYQMYGVSHLNNDYPKEKIFTLEELSKTLDDEGVSGIKKNVIDRLRCNSALMRKERY